MGQYKPTWCRGEVSTCRKYQRSTFDRIKPCRECGWLPDLDKSKKIEKPDRDSKAFNLVIEIWRIEKAWLEETAIQNDKLERLRDYEKADLLLDRMLEAQNRLIRL